MCSKFKGIHGDSLIVKEYPESSTNALALKSLLKDLEDKKKFFDYASYYSIKYQKNDIKVHTLVLSSYYKSNSCVNYKWHGSSQFTIPYKSFKSFDGDKTINNISLKNKNNEELSKSEIGDLRILTFMKSKRSPRELLIKSIELTQAAKMGERDRLHTAVLQSFLAKKFITDNEEYKEVMKMIDESALDFKGILGRRDRIYYEEGIEEGQKLRNYQVAKDLLNEGLDEETIKRVSRLDSSEIKKLKNQCSK